MERKRTQTATKERGREKARLTKSLCDEPLFGGGGGVQLIGFVQDLIQGERVILPLHVTGLHVANNLSYNRNSLYCTFKTQQI